MNKSWIWCQDKLSDEYTNGVESFIEPAKNHLDNDNKTCCSCRHCRNVYVQKIDVVERHLWLKGFSWDYQNWIFHGEPLIVNNVDDDLEGVQDDDMMTTLQDATGGMHFDVTGDGFPDEQNTFKEDFLDLF